MLTAGVTFVKPPASGGAAAVDRANGVPYCPGPSDTAT